MLQATEKIWLNGTFVPWNDAKVHVLTHTLHYGTGVFEGIRSYKTGSGSAVFRLKEHVDRLFASAHICQMDMPFTREQVGEAILETIRANKIDACYIRPLAYIGYGAMGIFPKENPISVTIAVWPWGSYLGEEGLKNGIRVKISSFTRPHVNATMVRTKTVANYANSLLAKREALKDGYNEAMLLDTEGYVAEGSGENVFIVRNGTLKTPPLTAILEGITRDTVMQLARVRPEHALRHPNWKMGKKVTVDSATMMNKGLEVIEAKWLFNMPLDKIRVFVHPQSIVHAMLELRDGTMLADLSNPDMRGPIGHALFYPDSMSDHLPSVNLARIGTLQFCAPDVKKFRCLRLAYLALEAGETMPAVLNAANEVAVNAFLSRRIRFTDIPAVNEKTMDRFKPAAIHSIDDVLMAYAWARHMAGELILRLN